MLYYVSPSLLTNTLYLLRLHLLLSSPSLSLTPYLLASFPRTIFPHQSQSPPTFFFFSSLPSLLFILPSLLFHPLSYGAFIFSTLLPLYTFCQSKFLLVISFSSVLFSVTQFFRAVNLSNAISAFSLFMYFTERRLIGFAVGGNFVLILSEMSQHN